MGLGVAFVVFTWQFLFALISLFGFAVQAMYDSLLEGTIGTILSYTIGFIFDIKDWIPGEFLGMVFWGLSTILSIGVFVIFWFWYKLNGIDPFKTTSGFLITTICFSLSIFPVTNLFPWLVLWIIYINVSSIFLRS